MKNLYAAIAAILLVSSVGTADEPALAADLVLVNGKVWTGDRKNPRAEAIAVWRDRIVAVGTSDDVRRLAGRDTKVIDLNGRRVVPGFHDSHVHMLGAGIRISQVSLKDAKTEAEFGKRLREFDRKLPRDRWLLGGNWDHDRTFDGKLPSAALIDRFVYDRPVMLRRYDGHMAIANTAALKLAGITRDTPDPPGGVIDRKEGSKEPTGILRDNAMGLVDKVIPPTSSGEMIEAVRAALAVAKKFGVTSVQDMDGSPTATRTELFRLYQRMAKSGDLTTRIDLRWPLADWKELANLGVQEGFGDDWVRIGGLKGFVDGSLGSSTAKMFDPYINEPGSTGVYVTPLSQLRKFIVNADSAGLNVAVHAIGDRANAELLDIYADVLKTNGPRDRRFRIEHAQHLRPEDIKRFPTLSVVASLQPYHIIDDGRWAEGRIGAKRCASSYANRALLDVNANLAFGSDWPVAPLNPLLGIDAAVNRRTLDGKYPNGWFPEQKITVREAVEAYTLGSAHAAHQDRDRGSLVTGKLADVVVLSRDIFDAKERDRIAETQVEMTIVGGKVVFEKSK